MKTNVIQTKSYEFSLLVIDTYQKLIIDKYYVLWKQFLRSGTSIWANVEEALWSQSKKEFYAKMSIVYREARETEYWIKLLFYAKYIPEILSKQLLEKIWEILKIVGSIRKTLLNFQTNILNS